MSALVDEEAAAELRLALADACSVRDGVQTLVALLGRDAAADAAWADPHARQGVKALLDGLRTRMDLACDGLQAVALALGVPVEPQP